MDIFLQHQQGNIPASSQVRPPFDCNHAAFNCVYESPFISATSAAIDVKQLLVDLITTAPSETCPQNEKMMLLDYLTNGGVRTFPRFTSVSHPGIKVRGLLIRYQVAAGEKERYQCALSVLLSDGESQLLWLPWLPHQQKPIRNPGEYHHVRPGGAVYALQARRTKCYDRAYQYSGQMHPIEQDTPSTINPGLYQETNAIFQLPQDGKGGVNMCLENDYDHGRHYISEHSDDERAFGTIHDVYCWITGNASREAVFEFGRPGREPLQRYVPD